MSRSRRGKSRRCSDCGYAGCEWCCPKRITAEKRQPENGLDIQRREISYEDLWIGWDDDWGSPLNKSRAA